MKINEITQQAIEHNRETLENYIKGIVALQEQTEGLVEETIGNAELIPEEGRKALQGLLRLGREYREEVQQQVQRGREQIEQQVQRGREEFEKLFPQVQ